MYKSIAREWLFVSVNLSDRSSLLVKRYWRLKFLYMIDKCPIKAFIKRLSNFLSPPIGYTFIFILYIFYIYKDIIHPAPHTPTAS